MSKSFFFLLISLYINGRTTVNKDSIVTLSLSASAVMVGNCFLKYSDGILLLFKVRGEPPSIISRVHTSSRVPHVTQESCKLITQRLSSLGLLHMHPTHLYSNYYLCLHSTRTNSIIQLSFVHVGIPIH